MSTEIERKFKVINDDWQNSCDHGIQIIQGYMNGVRIRIKGDMASLTIKSDHVKNMITRTEYEYEIPLLDALNLLKNFCTSNIIKKTRYNTIYDDVIWEIDVFDGDDQGLIVAELELPNEDCKVKLPSWVGEEVTQDDRYYNIELSKNSYSNW